QFDADDGRKALTAVFAGQVLFVFFYKVVLAGIVVQYPGNSGPETGQVSAAIRVMDVVGKGFDVLGEAVGVLDSDLDDGVFDLSLDVESVVDDFFVAVKMLDVALDAALEVVAVTLTSRLIK